MRPAWTALVIPSNCLRNIQATFGCSKLIRKNLEPPTCRVRTIIPSLSSSSVSG